MHARAVASVSQPPQVVFEFLSDLENHWRLASSFIALERVEHRDAAPDGGRIELRGPFGIARAAETRLVRVEPPADGVARVEGIARTDTGTVARITWLVRPARAGSRVELEAAIGVARGLDRLLLRLGGLSWLRLCLRRSLANLESALANA